MKFFILVRAMKMATIVVSVLLIGAGDNELGHLTSAIS